MINEVRLAVAEFLNIVLIENQFIFFNLWHIIHFISGAVVMFLLFKFYKKTKWKLLILLGILALYELFELSVIAAGSNLFRREIRLDVLFDLIMGFLGGSLVFYFKRDK